MTSLCLTSFADIVELDDSKFTNNIIQAPNADLWFVKFYQPWCGYCSKMQPEWEQADTAIHLESESNQQSVNIHFSQLDCGTSPNACDRLGIYGYPTLNLFVNGTMYEFPKNQERNAENFVKFVKGGYLDVASKSIPSGVSWAETLRKEVEQVWHNSKFIFYRYPEVASCFVAIGTFVGIATTSLAFMMTMSMSPATATKEKTQ